MREERILGKRAEEWYGDENEILEQLKEVRRAEKLSGRKHQINCRNEQRLEYEEPWNAYNNIS